MIPLELKRDKDGLLYASDEDIVKRPSLLIDHRPVNEYRYDQCGFYSFDSTDEYIIKYYYNRVIRRTRKLTKQMLINLITRQKNIPDVDFPIGYFKEKYYLAGLIIKYYKTGISLDNICKDKSLSLLSKYYYHDEDDIHNVFLLFYELLDIIYEMFENGVYYNDIHPGNIVIFDNKIKIIDFDPYRVRFDNKDERLSNIMNNYCLFMKIVLKEFNLVDKFGDMYNNFQEAKVFTKKLENSIRKNR